MHLFTRSGHQSLLDGARSHYLLPELDTLPYPSTVHNSPTPSPRYGVVTIWYGTVTTLIYFLPPPNLITGAGLDFPLNFYYVTT